MKFSFKAVSILTLDHQHGDDYSSHCETSVHLELSPGIKRDMYLNDEGIPTKEGARVLSKVLVSALAANIHYSHQSGHKNDVEHIKEIIADLTKQFAANAKVFTVSEEG